MTTTNLEFKLAIHKLREAPVIEIHRDGKMIGTIAASENGISVVSAYVEWSGTNDVKLFVPSKAKTDTVRTIFIRFES